VKRRQFRVRTLLLGWTAYWLALIVVGLSPAIVAIWRMSQTPHGKGGVNAGVTDGVFSATVLQNGITTWSGSISFLALTLLIAVPPLLMWAFFFLTNSRTNNAGKTPFVGGPNAAQLNAAEPETLRNSDSTTKRRSREGT
jgi:hypothetical protein